MARTESNLSPHGLDILGVLNEAADKAIDRKRRLGQYWVVWDGEKPVKVFPENPVDTAAE